MQVVATPIEGLLVLEPKVFGDDRGFFFESFNERIFRERTGVELPFVQDNHSRSARGVLRGLHYQIRQPQGKLVRAVRGAVYDVALDVRRASATFGQWFGIELSEQNKRMLWVPPGFAHGFCVVSESADFLYKTTDYWAQDHERAVAWNDPKLAIPWPLGGIEPMLSAKDRAGVPLAQAEVFE